MENESFREALARAKAELPLIHRACALLPFMTDDEFRSLVESIRHRGLRHPILTLDGLILDGKCRWIACRIAGVEPRFVPWVPNGDDNPFHYVNSTNVLRASYSQAELAEIRVAVEEKARRWAETSGGTGGDHCRPSTDADQDPGRTETEMEEKKP